MCLVGRGILTVGGCAVASGRMGILTIGGCAVCLVGRGY